MYSGVWPRVPHQAIVWPDKPGEDEIRAGLDQYTDIGTASSTSSRRGALSRVVVLAKPGFNPVQQASQARIEALIGVEIPALKHEPRQLAECRKATARSDLLEEGGDHGPVGHLVSAKVSHPQLRGRAERGAYHVVVEHPDHRRRSPDIGVEWLEGAEAELDRPQPPGGEDDRRAPQQGWES